MRNIVKIRDLVFDKDLFVNYLSGTVLDRLLCSYDGLPKGVNYMIIGDPGVGKTTIILDLMANIQRMQPAARMLFVSAEMNEIDLSIYVQRYPKFGNLDIMFVEAEFDSDSHALENFAETLQEGWDIVAIDSFYELQGIVKEEEDITLKKIGKPVACHHEETEQSRQQARCPYFIPDHPTGHQKWGFCGQQPSQAHDYGHDGTSAR